VDVLMVFAWLVFITMMVAVLAILGFLAAWPGRVARQRQHPYADAIAVGGWVTLLTGFVLWPLVLIWAYATPVGRAGS